MSNSISTEFQLKLLLSSLRINCKFFDGYGKPCRLSEQHNFETDLGVHFVCNCNGDIDDCGLPEKFQNLLI